MSSLGKRDQRKRCCRRRPLELQQRLECPGGQSKDKKTVWQVRQPIWPVLRPVWLMRLVSLEVPPRPRTRQGWASRSSWTIKETLKSRRDGQTKLRIQRHRLGIKINWILKVIVLLCHIHLMYRLLYGFGHILVIIRLWIIAGCICSHITFNMLLYVQVVPHKDLL